MNMPGVEEFFDEKLMEAHAKAAGLQIALDKFHADMVAAARLVESQRQALGDWPALSDEPWPPMQTEPTR